MAKKPCFRDVSLIKSVFRVQDFPLPKLPEIAFLGRSNAGKSSLINALLGQKRVARVSSTPGFTQSINFFRVDHKFLIVDLPGYGFAKAPAKIRKNWQRLIESYLSSPRPLKFLVLVFDIRRTPYKLDYMLIDYVKKFDHPFVIALNKIDQIKKTERLKFKNIWQTALSCLEVSFFLISCRTGEGIPDLRKFILNFFR